MVLQPRQGNGFTLIELILVISIISALSVFASDRFLYWQERAEKAAMESILSGVKMGLQIRMAEMMASNQMNARELETENPIRWLQERPASYAGDYVPPVTSGNWYYATLEHELVYVLNNRAYLRTDADTPKELRFRVSIRQDVDPVLGTKTLAGVNLVPAMPYRWF
jgi:prepilin-type N-terminal cleavage/methylation domain-containing protein